MTKAIKITLSDKDADDIARVAKDQGRPVADLAKFWVLFGLEETRRRGEIPDKVKPPESDHPSS